MTDGGVRGERSSLKRDTESRPDKTEQAAWGKEGKDSVKDDARFLSRCTGGTVIHPGGSLTKMEKREEQV